MQEYRPPDATHIKKTSSYCNNKKFESPCHLATKIPEQKIPKICNEMLQNWRKKLLKLLRLDCLEENDYFLIAHSWTKTKQVFHMGSIGYLLP